MDDLGYSYNIHKLRKSSIRWCCDSRYRDKCSASVLQTASGYRKNQDHNHSPNEQWLARLQLTSQIKTQVASGDTRTVASIVEEALGKKIAEGETPLPTLPRREGLMNLARRVRRRIEGQATNTNTAASSVADANTSGNENQTSNLDPSANVDNTQASVAPEADTL